MIAKVVKQEEKYWVEDSKLYESIDADGEAFVLKKSIKSYEDYYKFE